MKTEKKEKREWFSLSFSFTMRDMENEPDLYDIADIKVMFT